MLVVKSKKILLLFFVFLNVFMLSVYGGIASADSSDLQSILNGTPYYDGGATSCGILGSVPVPNIPSTASTSGTWTSNTTGPYYLEEFAINVLKDVAQKTGSSDSSTVTQEHVIALIGWFFREGGDIGDGPPSSNPDPNLFNPLNTSIQDPSLESTSAGGGLESFKSFNAGVEGTARTIVGSYQDRIAAILTQQYSTAEQVASTIANFQNYKGNLAWASPAGNPTEAEIIADNQNNYLPSLLTQIEQARNSYAKEATLELGTPEAESLIPADHVSASLLQYQPTITSSTGISTGASTQPDTDASSSGCTTNVSCTNSSPTSSSTDNVTLSQLRQTVVCIATNELVEHWQLPLTPAQKQYYLAYTQNSPEQWCADFASWVYNQAGDPFQGGGDWRLPAVAQIQSLGQQNLSFFWHPQSSNYVPKPGDLAIHFDGSIDSHVNIVVAVNGSSVTYIGGDQGDGPYGGPDSASVVSYDNQVGYYNEGIIGYVSPDN
ncbi:MAG TPA: CHAP domain-containing protein [Candidatus Saccharimonadales bacterium]